MQSGNWFKIVKKSIQHSPRNDMRHEYLMTKGLFIESRRIGKNCKNVKFKSEKNQLDTKAKELLTKFRKGLIWKNL